MSKLSNTNNPKSSKREQTLRVRELLYVERSQGRLKRFIGGYREGEHLLPFRTEKLSPLSPMILQQVCGKVGRCQLDIERRARVLVSFFLCCCGRMTTFFI